MTIGVLTAGRAQIAGDGVTDRVDLDFQFIDQNNLEVVHVDGNGKRTEWIYGLSPGAWSFTGGNFATGTVHFTAADLQGGEQLIISLTSSYAQPYAFDGGEIDPAVIERALDRSAIDMQSVANRALFEKEGVYDVAGTPVTGVPDPGNPEDAVNKRTLDAVTPTLDGLAASAAASASEAAGYAALADAALSDAVEEAEAAKTEADRAATLAAGMDAYRDAFQTYGYLADWGTITEAPGDILDYGDITA